MFAECQKLFYVLSNYPRRLLGTPQDDLCSKMPTTLAWSCDVSSIRSGAYASLGETMY